MAGDYDPQKRIDDLGRTKEYRDRALDSSSACHYVQEIPGTFRPYRACKKCGSTDLNIQWHGGDVNLRHGNYLVDRCEAVGEHLCCHCRCCQYKWRDPTQDQLEVAPQVVSVGSTQNWDGNWYVLGLPEEK